MIYIFTTFNFLLIGFFLPLSLFGGTPERVFSFDEVKALYGSSYSRLGIQSEVVSSSHPLRETIKNQYVKTQKSLLTDLSQWYPPKYLVYLEDKLTNRELSLFLDILIKWDVEGLEKGIEYKLFDNLDRKELRVISRIEKVKEEVDKLKSLHKKGVGLALSKHEHELEQKYGGAPYSFHLRQVREVLKRFGYGPRDSFFGLLLGTAAWLHDIVEDTDVTRNKLARVVGEEIAKIVIGVTKVEKLAGMTSRDVLIQTYSKARILRGSRILKIADRIANVEKGLADLFAGNPTKVYKYFNEWELFKKLLYVPGEADAMWLHLERLFRDQLYAKTTVQNLKDIKIEVGAKATSCRYLFLPK